MPSTGEFGRGGHRRVHACLNLEGTFTERYCAFLEDKARRLGLPLTLSHDKSSVVAKLSGPEALIGAFEMSAIIGTEDSTVDIWSLRLSGADVGSVA